VFALENLANERKCASMSQFWPNFGLEMLFKCVLSVSGINSSDATLAISLVPMFNPFPQYCASLNSNATERAIFSSQLSVNSEIVSLQSELAHLSTTGIATVIVIPSSTGEVYFGDIKY